MKKTKRRQRFDTTFERKVIPESLIDTATSLDDYDKKQLKNRSAYFMLNGAPEFAVNETEKGRFKLLANERDFFAVKLTGAREIAVRVYSFTDENAERFSLLERLKTERLGAMEEGYLMQRLIKEFGFTQDDIASLIGKSRPAVAHT